MKMMIAIDDDGIYPYPANDTPNIPGAYLENVWEEQSRSVTLTTVKNPKAIINDLGEAQLVWEPRTQHSAMWEEYIKVGKDHTRKRVNDRLEVWTRYVEERRWFIDIDTLEDLIGLRNYIACFHLDSGYGDYPAIEAYV